MPRLALSLARAGAASAFVLTIGSAHAATIDHTWVSSTGSGTACTRAAPCGDLNSAYNATNAGGVISVLDPGDYLGALIFKSITIRAEGVDGGATVTASPLGYWIPNLCRRRRRGHAGRAAPQRHRRHPVQFWRSSLHVVGCVITNSNISGYAGISFRPNSASKLSVTDTVISNMGAGTGGGIVINPQAGGSAQVAFKRVTVNGNAFGIARTGPPSPGAPI